MSTFSLKLSDKLTQEIEYAAKKKGISKSLFVREAVVQYLQGGSEDSANGSFLDLASDLCGSIKGSKDLSTNKKHLDGFGE